MNIHGRVPTAVNTVCFIALSPQCGFVDEHGLCSVGQVAASFTIAGAGISACTIPYRLCMRMKTSGQHVRAPGHPIPLTLMTYFMGRISKTLTQTPATSGAYASRPMMPACMLSVRFRLRLFCAGDLYL